MKEPSSFRWLSLESAVTAIFNSYSAIVCALENKASKDVPEAKGLLKRVKSVSFLLRTAFLVDVMGVVNKLCKVFQKDEVDVDTVAVMVNCTTDTLLAYKNENGPKLQQIYVDIES